MKLMVLGHLYASTCHRSSSEISLSVTNLSSAALKGNRVFELFWPKISFQILPFWCEICFCSVLQRVKVYCLIWYFFPLSFIDMLTEKSKISRFSALRNMFGCETGYRRWRIEKLQSIPCDLSIVKAGFHLRRSVQNPCADALEHRVTMIRRAVE